ncbi:pyroglutamyl-peptidase [Pilibacter termitis]|uniref:Pyrrolidone-carboxylate peptidase n=1 Tax=Pilibacter termitis TaxID=263852 RepID=A0A1T4LIZ5_9ENTE|nr:pyroglutamyl-peptidase I [Pilibacter termitis]SJZ54586.1 pyroglutamyl-peptidase [Pilibacter termitis]
MKVLITGFDPFGTEVINPSFEAVKHLPKKIANAEIIKLELPTVFQKSSEILKKEIQIHHPEIVICVGQAGGRASISLERVAINLAEARIPDNEGNQPVDKKIEIAGETAYFTNLPIKAMMKNIQQHSLPAEISYTAGTFVCNDIFYRLMYLINNDYPKIKGGFIHVPFSHEQVNGRENLPSMSLDDITRSLFYAIESAVTVKVDILENVGVTH